MDRTEFRLWRLLIIGGILVLLALPANIAVTSILNSDDRTECAPHQALVQGEENLEYCVPLVGLNVNQGGE